jgi:hypothetical protein
LSWVVAGAGADGHFAVVGSVGFYADGAVSTEGGGFGGVVADGVLVANVFGYFCGDDVDVGERVGEEGEAAGFVGEKLEGAAGAMGFLALVLIAEEEADGVDDGTAEILNAANGLLEIEGGGVVFAVGDDEDDLLGAAGSMGELIGGGDDSVVECGAAAGFDVAEAFAELIDVGGEVLVEEGFVREVDDEGFVLRVGGADEIEGGGVDGCALVAHGAGVVDEDAEGDGDVGVGEGDDGLKSVVFEDVEVGLLEVEDEVAILIDDGAGKNDFVDVAGEGVDALLALDFLVAGVGMGGADGGVVGGVGGDDGVAVDVEGGLGLGSLGRWDDCLRAGDGGGLRGLGSGGGPGGGILGLGLGAGARGKNAQGSGSKEEAEEESEVTAGTHRFRNVHAL